MITRRDFFGAAAGTLVATQGTQVKAEESRGFSFKQMLGAVQTGMRSDPLWISERPELELGHSARWKVQRYPGAKWVPIHKDWGFRINHIREIYPVITNVCEREEMPYLFDNQTRQAS